MKKLLMLILIGLLVILSIFIVINGFEIGGIQVLSYTGIQEKDKELDEKIQEASKLAERDYKQAVSNVQENSRKLEQEKKEYEEMTLISSEGDVQAAKQIEKYEVETLWVKLGNYATSEGTVIKMDIVQGNTNETYNLRFTINGSYISITYFISDIENDSTLGFKIEEFKMLPGSGADLQATFVCKEIAIKGVTETTNPNLGTEATTGTEGTTNTTNNATNSANTTNTTNTTNQNTANGNTTSQNTANGNTAGNTSVAQ